MLSKVDGLAEARSLCAAQMDEAHALLADDAAFRAEYMRLWEAQRKHPVSPYSVSLLSVLWTCFNTVFPVLLYCGFGSSPTPSVCTRAIQSEAWCHCTDCPVQHHENR